ncbi:MAG: hypothetical protein P4L51_17775 [Puia sp.]|nr:hypothetical protein [Puia sp.]
MSLITKTQYRNYEPGEFTDRKERTFEETIQLIDGFPWEKQRKYISVSLTNPSVTIEGKNNDFLKLCPYYEGKFVLYYLNDRKKLYTLSLSKYSDSYPYIQSFFENERFDPKGFKLETTWFQKKKIHFEDKDFEYRPDITDLLLNPPVIAVVSVPLTVSLLAIGMKTGLPVPFVIGGLVPLGLLIVSFSLFVNHYKASKDKVLILSKGKDEFFYGEEDSPAKFNKKDILDVTTYGMRQRGGYSCLTRVEINFKDGHSIDLSCLMLFHEKLMPKFTGVATHKRMRPFPFIPGSSTS